METINWKLDSINVIRAKQELSKFLEEQRQLKGRSDKIDSYHERRIKELKAIIQH